MAFELVHRELCSGMIGGVQYGASARLLVRAPKAIVITSLGLHFIHRRSGRFESNRDHVTISREKASKASIQRAAARLDELFEAGVGAAASIAWSKHQTVVVDGGGESMPLPRVQARLVSQAYHASVAVDWDDDLTGQIATCKQCGANLRPRVDNHWFKFGVTPDQPRSLDECRKFTNARIIRVRGYDQRYDHTAYEGLIEMFSTWDGESTENEDFCDDKCAALYGRRAAQDLPLLDPGLEPRRRAFVAPESKHHYEEPERWIEGSDGKRIRI